MQKAAIAVAVVLVLAVGIGQSSSNKRAFVAGKYALEIDGTTAGWLFSCEGGEIHAEVISEVSGDDPVTRKRPGRVKYGDITLKCGTGMSKALYQWITETLDQRHSRKSGAIIAADFNFKEHSRLEFQNALLTEVGMPALDAASKDAAKMTIKISPEVLKQVPGSGRAVKIDPRVQKKWLPANFRLQIDGLDCSRVNKIEALTIKQKVTESAVGEVGRLEPAAVEVPNLVLTLAESHSQTFYDWFEEFVLKGNSTQDREKGGSLEYLAADLQEVLFTLTFQNLGIFKIAPDKSEAGGEAIRRVKAEMYCEQMKFKDLGASALLGGR
jgi:phage tail-like protein